jgi:hypothetical protein
MAKEGQKRGSSSLNLSSGFLKTLLVVLSVILIFAGPTYGVYVLMHVLKLSYLKSMGGGFVLFIVGFVLLLYLIKKGVIK